VPALAPLADEMVFPKTSSSVFISTNLDYVLRNLGTRYLIIAGCLTDQCVDSAVRDACDLGYLVTVVTDACVTQSAERQESSLRNNRGYCRQRSTAEILAEFCA
jgi:ureidoacrylate peracid hydrolase